MLGPISSLPSEPPRFFKRGPSPLARLTFFGIAAVVLMFVDARYRTLDAVRSTLSTALYPAQQLALVPAEMMRETAEMFESRKALRDNNAALKAELLKTSQAAQAQVASEQEAARLAKLLGISSVTPTKAEAARVLYLGRDPFSQKAFISRHNEQPFEAGAAVIDENGLLGQLTRVHPLFAEMTLLTDKDFSVPVKIERTGLRALLYGRGPGRLPELRFVANDADVKADDVILTSSIDGVYPRNIRIGAVKTSARDPSSAFARIDVTPAANILAVDAVLVLAKPPAVPSLPALTTPQTVAPTESLHKLRR